MSEIYFFTGGEMFEIPIIAGTCYTETMFKFHLVIVLKGIANDFRKHYIQLTYEIDNTAITRTCNLLIKMIEVINLDNERRLRKMSIPRLKLYVLYLLDTEVSYTCNVSVARMSTSF